jgi:hypothetical protein
MPIHRRNAPAVKNNAIKMYLPFILAAALGCQVLGCASARLTDQGPPPDGGTTDTNLVANGKDASDPNGKSDGATSYGVCDPFSNAGCASGQKCSTLRNGSTLTPGCGSKGSNGEGDQCTPVPATGQQTGDDCGDGLACFSLGAGQLNSFCHRICALSGPDTCPGTEICTLKVSNLAGIGLAFCQATIPCQALDQTGCSADQACYYEPKGAICAPLGTAPAGSSCTNANDCAKGSTCLTINGIGTCFAFCSAANGGSPSCSGGTTCALLTGETVLGTCR